MSAHTLRFLFSEKNTGRTVLDENTNARPYWTRGDDIEMELAFENQDGSFLTSSDVGSIEVVVREYSDDESAPKLMTITKGSADCDSGFTASDWTSGDSQLFTASWDREDCALDVDSGSSQSYLVYAVHTDSDDNKTTYGGYVIEVRKAPHASATLATPDPPEETPLTTTAGDARYSLAPLDEDDFSSDSDSRPPTQQSCKAYVDNEVSTALSSQTVAKQVSPQTPFNFGGVESSPETVSDCVSYWRAAAGATLSDLVGSNDLTVQGSPTVAADGGLEMDGTSQSVYGGISGLTPTGDFTLVSFWKRVVDTGSSSDSCVWGLTDASSNNDWAISKMRDNVFWGTLDQGVATPDMGVFVGDGEYAAVSMVFEDNGDGTHTLTLYNWGTISTSETGTVPSASLDRICFGANKRLSSDPYGTGTWYEGGMYNRALSEIELKEIANGQIELWATPADFPDMHLALIGGQSNARSYGTESNTGDYTASGTEGDNLLCYDEGSGSGDEENLPMPLKIQQNGGADFVFGPEMGIAKRLNQFGELGAFFKVAKGGTQFGTAASPGDWYPSTGTLALQFMEMAKISPWIVRAHGYTPIMGSIFWVHGEADSIGGGGASSADKGAVYEDNLLALWEDISGALGVRVGLVVTEVRGGSDAVRLAQLSIGSKPRGSYYSTSHLNFVDSQHYDAESVEEMGKDLADYL